jgi:hypothetical protein
MRAHVLAVVLLGLVGGCIDSEFLRGAKCSDDRECGRSLSCEHGVCGGCPPEVPLVGDRCPCPGDRVLDCRPLEAPYCMPVCRTASELCEVVEVRNDDSTVAFASCTDPSADRCFEVLFDAPGCPDGEARIRLQPEEDAAELIVNCPPPDSDESRFDCEPP